MFRGSPGLGVARGRSSSLSVQRQAKKAGKREKRGKALLVPQSEDLQVARAHGSHLYDQRGKRYVDFNMGWCVGNFGWDNQVIKKCIRGYRGPDYVNPNYFCKEWGELAELLAEIAPGKLRRSFRATGGTEAVEIALQAAMLHTGRGKFVSIEDSYHGNSLATISVAGTESRKPYKNLLSGCHTIDLPLDHKAAEKLETLLKRRDVAGFIMEPIICNLAVYIPDREFMQRVQALCRRYGTVLIADEVACGFGRTGKLFASEHFHLEPDIMCLAKAITGGCAGLGATLVTEAIAKSARDELFVWSTYGWHPLSTAAAIVNIRNIVNHKAKLLAHVISMGEYFQARLSAMRFRSPAQIRVKGLAIGIQVEDESYPEKIEGKCRKDGLLISADEDTISLFPALTIDLSTARDGLDILEAAL